MTNGALTPPCSDVFEEARWREGELFGRERACSVVRANCHRTARDIIDSLTLAVRDFSYREASRDDVTVVGIGLAISA